MIANAPTWGGVRGLSSLYASNADRDARFGIQAKLAAIEQMLRQRDRFNLVLRDIAHQRAIEKAQAKARKDKRNRMIAMGAGALAGGIALPLAAPALGLAGTAATASAPATAGIFGAGGALTAGGTAGAALTGAGLVGGLAGGIAAGDPNPLMQVGRDALSWYTENAATEPNLFYDPIEKAVETAGAAGGVGGGTKVRSPEDSATKDLEQYGY